MTERHTVAVCCLALTLLAGCGGDLVVAQAPFGAPSSSATPIAADTPSATPAPVAADGFRLVGYGDLAVEVPASWGTNRLRCSAPTKDTVLIDIGAVRRCGAPRPENVDSVSIGRASKDYRFDGGEETTFAGRSALRTPTTCAKDDFGGARTCAATLHFPAEGVVFVAESSTSKEVVEKILSRVRAVPGSVGVPGFRDDNWSVDDEEHPPYLEELRDAGLVAKVTYERRPGLPEGYVLASKPAPGSVLRPGDTVEVTVVPAPRGLADKVFTSLAYGPGGAAQEKHLRHEEIAAGTEIRLPVGGRIRIYGKGPDLTYNGTLDGDSLVRDPSTERSGAAHFTAKRKGTTQLTVTVTDGTTTDQVGTVAVVVE